MTERSVFRLRGLVWLPVALSLSACAGMRATDYAYTSSYDFRGKTIGLSVILDRQEQEALDENRIVRRTISGVENEGYADDPTIGATQEDVGVVTAPASVRDLAMRLTHSRYYDDELIHPMIDMTRRILERHGFAVKVVPVPAGDFRLQELADNARRMGCDILAVETITLVRSWNVRGAYRSTGSQQLSTSFRWRRQVGGMVLANMSLIDIPSRKLVWQHAEREINTDALGPLLGELFDQTAAGRFGRRQSGYQASLYRQSATRALDLLFATNAAGFRRVPDGSDRPDSLLEATRYQPGDAVFVFPDGSTHIWHAGTVVADDGGGQVTVRWLEGTWPAFTERTTFPRTRVMPREDQWAPLVWVRDRDKLVYAPYPFVRIGRDSLAHVNLAGDQVDRTFLPGRAGIIPE